VRTNKRQSETVMTEYKGFTREEPLRFDMLVEDAYWWKSRRGEGVPIHKGNS